MTKARFTAIPAARSAANVLRVRLILVFTVLTITCLSGLFAGYAYLSFEPKYVDVYEPLPLARAEATVVAEAYMNGSMYAVSLTANMAKTFADTKFSKVDKVGPLVWSSFERKNSIIRSVDTDMVELHKFLYVRPTTIVENDQTLESVELMSLYVLMYIPQIYVDEQWVPDPQYPPALAALPSIATEEVFQLAQVLDYSAEATPPSKEVSHMLLIWANYWAAGDSSGLKKVSGDSDVLVTRYKSLKGYTVNSFDVLGLVQGGDGTINVIRARLVLGGANGSILITDMDITVTKANTGLPEVTGWGPAGSGVLALEDIRLGS